MYHHQRKANSYNYGPSNTRQNRQIFLNNTNAVVVTDLGNGFLMYKWGRFIISPNENVSIILSPGPGEKVIAGGYGNNASFIPTLIANQPAESRKWVVIVKNSNPGSADMDFTLVAKK
ncbi:hypothetical protein YSY43_30400 [Paenibacillus sp. YSY-4.3]